MGRPNFQSRGPQTPIFKGFWDLWTENRGAPKTPNSATTDLTPHLRPSENSWVDFLRLSCQAERPQDKFTLTSKNSTQKRGQKSEGIPIPPISGLKSFLRWGGWDVFVLWSPRWRNWYTRLFYRLPTPPLSFLSLLSWRQAGKNQKNNDFYSSQTLQRGIVWGLAETIVCSQIKKMCVCNHFGPLSISEAWGPPQFQEKRSRNEKAILGALGEFRGILGTALGIQKLILRTRNSTLVMASHDLNHNSRSNSRSDSQNLREPTWTGEIQKGRDRKCHKLSQILWRIFYDEFYDNGSKRRKLS